MRFDSCLTLSGFDMDFNAMTEIGSTRSAVFGEKLKHSTTSSAHRDP